MRKFGIQTGADLLSWDLADLNHHFGKIGKFLFNIARGIDDREVQPHRERKSIGNETTFANDVSTESEIISILTKLCERVGKTLEEKKTGGQCLTLKVRFSDFTTITRSLTQRAPIRNGREIYALLPRLLAVVDFSDKAIRLLGVTVSKLEKDKRPRQLMLPYMEIHTEKIPLQLFTQNQ